MSGAIVIGAGPGLGRSVARRFATHGLPVTALARRPETVEPLAHELESMGVPTLPLSADVTDEDSLRTALDRATERFGVPDVVVYNAARIQADAPTALPARGHLDAWAVNVVGALTTAGHVLPAMIGRGAGSFLLTGGMPAPVAAYTSLSLGKAGVRALVQLLDEEYGPAGIHVATVTVFGGIAPGTRFDPDDIAEHYWRLHRQPPGTWQREVAYTG